MTISVRKDILGYSYTICVVAAFSLLFFANAEQQFVPNRSIVSLGVGKSFYYPCAMALVISLFLRQKVDKLDLCMWLLFISVLISTIIHPPVENIVFTSWTSTRFLLAILCFFAVRNVDPVFFSKCVAYVSPLIIVPHYFLTDLFDYGPYRYGGFYGDPNFLAMALNIVICMCYITIKRAKNNVLKFIMFGSIIGSIPLILLGMSRAGIVGLVLILSVILFEMFKGGKKWILVIGIICISGLGYVAKMMNETFDNIGIRFSSDSEVDMIAARARWEGVDSAVGVLSNRPEFILFGIGPGNTIPMKEVYRADGYYCYYAIHNTFFSILYEMGLISFMLYLSIYVYAFRSLVKKRNYILFSTFVSTAFCLFVLPGECFMPAWIFLFFAANKNIERLDVI